MTKQDEVKQLKEQLAAATAAANVAEARATAAEDTLKATAQELEDEKTARNKFAEQTSKFFCKSDAERSDFKNGNLNEMKRTLEQNPSVARAVVEVANTIDNKMTSKELHKAVLEICTAFARAQQE